MIQKQDRHTLKRPMVHGNMSKPIVLVFDNSIMPFLVFKKNEEGNDYFPTEIWPIEKLKELLKR
jgi:hypothetical protein